MNWDNIKNLENGFKYEIIAPDGSRGEFFVNTEAIDLSVDEQEVTLHVIGVNTKQEIFSQGVLVSFNTDDLLDAVQGKKKLNPTKVMWLIYNVAQAYLCPQCNKGYE